VTMPETLHLSHREAEPNGGMPNSQQHSGPPQATAQHKKDQRSAHTAAILTLPPWLLCRKPKVQEGPPMTPAPRFCRGGRPFLNTSAHLIH
jgi:hypothetical protein